MSDGELPQNLDAERSVLGAILLDSAALPFVAPILGESDFFPDTHRRIYRAMLELSRRSAPIDVVTLREEFSKNGGVEKVGGDAYLAGLLDGVPEVANVEHYARIVKEKSARRVLIETGRRLVGEGLESAQPAAVVASKAVRDLSSLAGAADTPARAATPYDVLASTPPPGERMACGLTVLDKALRGGFARGRVYTFVGPPGMGKTALSIQIARTLVRKHGAFAVGLFADEGAWAAAVMLGEGEGFGRDQLENAFPTMSPEVHERLRGIPFLILDPDDPTVHLDAIDGLLDRAPADSPLVVVGDSVQTVRLGPETVAETRKERAEAVMAWARSLSRRRNAVVLLTAKANRASWAKKNPSDNTDSLAAGLDSSSIEYDSDAMFFLSGEPGQKTFLSIRKNRPGDGSKPTLALGFNRERATFHGIDPDVAQAEAETAARELREATWSGDEKRVLAELRRSPGSSQTKLAKLIGIRPATLSAVLAELERKNRAACPTGNGKSKLWYPAIVSGDEDQS